jgi:serine/threonine-protein kinase
LTRDGTRLDGRYRLGAALGRGGMADVYDAVDERLGRSVAVKILRPAMAANPDVRRRFESEARAAARLSHPNVVAVFDTGEDDETPFIVMERLPGDTLADRMATGPVDEAWLRAVAGDVLQALAAAHGAGIIHRDVKPGNILIAADGCAKVADFGIAKSLEPLLPGDDQTATNMLLGTPAYLAPERIEGQPATVQADLYALGVVLYEALAGRKPYQGTTPLAMAHAVQQGNVPPIEEVRPGVDPTLAHVIGRAMARRPEDRFTSADEMRVALEGDPTVVAELPLTAGAPVRDATTVLEPTTLAPAPILVGGEHPAAGASTATDPAWRQVMRQRWFVFVALGALLFLALLVFVATSGGSSAGRSTTPGTTTPMTAPPASTATTAGPPTTPAPAPAPAPAPKPGKDGGDKKKKG